MKTRGHARRHVEVIEIQDGDDGRLVDAVREQLSGCKRVLVSVRGDVATIRTRGGRSVSDAELDAVVTAAIAKRP